MSFRKYCRGMSQLEVLDEVFCQRLIYGQLENGIFVATLLPREQLECRLRNNLLLIDDIHMTITEGRGCVAEGTDKKKRSQHQKSGGLKKGNVLFETVWPGSTVKYSC